MGDENPIRTLEDYSRPSHEGYRNTIKLPDGNTMVPLRFDTIWLVQNGCSFHGLRFEDPNQHLKDFLKLVDSLDFDVTNRERTRLCLFQFSLRDKDSNWLERLHAGSISTWEDLTTRFLAQFFPPGKTAKLRNDILMFQQPQGESLSEAWTPRGKISDKNAKESWALLEDLALYDNKSWNDPRDFTKPVKAISLPQDVLSTSDRHLIKLENQVQCLMEAHLAHKSSIQVNKITSSCEICSGPHDTLYCMENREQAFVDYASLRTDEAGGKWYTFKPEQNNLESIEQFLNDFANQPNETNMNDLESDDELVDTPLVSPFPHSDNDSNDGEVINELIEYENVGMLRREKAINSFDGDDLAFQCMIRFRKSVAYFDPFLPMNIITRKAYNTIMVEGLESIGKNLVAVVRDVYVFVGSSPTSQILWYWKT
ncbi:MAK10-like protein [Tanacetum coccineum]|uniref:MAK10-like protein n=1 Tax=Tanacetum coccineum TaxID=301880 RepID=A0ABQ4ZGT5_9ASTR